VAYLQKHISTPGNPLAYQPKKFISYSDFDIGFLKHPTNGDLIQKRDELAIKQSIVTLVNLNTFDKPFHPEIGTDIRKLLFENFEYQIIDQIKRKIKLTINENEPRVELHSVDVYERPDKHALTVDINYTIIGRERDITTKFILERLR
jgi:phage baseplate assembly protein W